MGTFDLAIKLWLWFLLNYRFLMQVKTNKQGCLIFPTSQMHRNLICIIEHRFIIDENNWIYAKQNICPGSIWSPLENLVPISAELYIDLFCKLRQASRTNFRTLDVLSLSILSWYLSSFITREIVNEIVFISLKVTHGNYDQIVDAPLMWLCTLESYMLERDMSSGRSKMWME